MTAIEERTYTVSELLHLTGAKYRFVDYAIRTGRLSNDTANGSGHPRKFTTRDIDIVHAAVGLAAAGFTVDATFRIAADLVDHGVHAATFADIYQLVIVTGPPAREQTP